MKLCPYCSEEIQDSAKKCKHCGEWLDVSAKPEYTQKLEGWAEESCPDGNSMGPIGPDGQCPVFCPSAPGPVIESKKEQSRNLEKREDNVKSATLPPCDVKGEVTAKGIPRIAGTILSWLFGICFLLWGGSVWLVLELLPAIPPFAIALLLLPPVRNFVHSKTHKQLSFGFKAISIFVLVIACIIFLHISTQQLAQEQLEAKRTQEQARDTGQATKNTKAQKPEPPKTPEQAQKMKQTSYEVIRSQEVDKSPWKGHPGARRMRYDIRVSLDTDDNEVRSVLERALKELATRKEVDALAIRLFLDNSGDLPYATAHWAPYGDWAQAEKGKPKSIFDTKIEFQYNREPQKAAEVARKEVQKKETAEKDSLSVEKRQEIYREIYRSQDRTLEIAKQKYPNDAVKKWGYARQLDKEYEKRICERFGITEQQKSSILSEGLTRNWPH